MRFRQHMPGFCDFEPYEISADTFSEILNDPRIQRLANEKGHYRFSISPNDGKWSKSILMHEYDDGYTWYVIGYCEATPEETGLPIWEAKYTEERKREMAQPVKYVDHSNGAFNKAVEHITKEVFKAAADKLQIEIDKETK